MYSRFESFLKKYVLQIIFCQFVACIFPLNSAFWWIVVRPVFHFFPLMRTMFCVLRSLPVPKSWRCSSVFSRNFSVLIFYILNRNCLWCKGGRGSHDWYIFFPYGSQLITFAINEVIPYVGLFMNSSVPWSALSVTAPVLHCLNYTKALV